MADTLISLSGVGLTLPSQAGDVEILRGIDLAVAARESLGIVGPSGSGKSSLLMVLGGLERATSGSVSVLGEELTALDEDALRDLVADIVREELQGALGERITRNVRKLVRREIHRALAAQELE